MHRTKRLIASCLFVVILGVLVYGTTQLLKPAMGEYIQQPEFYKLPKNSLDFAVIGSSHAYCTFDPIQIEEKTGLKSFTFASAALSFPGRLCYLKELYKTQNPTVVYMDITGADLANEDFEKHRHENFSYLPVSLSRYKYALESVRSNLWEEMVFPLRLYHSNWKSFSSLSVKQFVWRASVGKRGYVTLVDNSPIRFSQDNGSALVSIDKKKLEIIDQIVEVTSQNNTKLVLFAAPMGMENQAAYLKYFQNRYKAFENVSYLNMNQWISDANLLADEDFYDSNHLNAHGVKKLTPFLAKHVIEFLP